VWSRGTSCGPGVHVMDFRDAWCGPMVYVVSQWARDMWCGPEICCVVQGYIVESKYTQGGPEVRGVIQTLTR